MPEPAAPLSILVVDDDPVARLLTRHMLEPEGHTVVDVASPVAAREALDAQSFSLILCDFEMGEENGLDLLASLGSNHPPFALLTGVMDRKRLASDATDEEDEAMIHSAGVMGFLSKPVSTDELRALVNQLANA